MANDIMKERLKQLDNEYTSSVDLSDRSLTSIVGPTRVGKSFIIKDVVNLGPTMGYNVPGDTIEEVDTITTRARRADDPKTYRTATEGVTHSTMMGMIRRSELVQVALFETGDIYGTDAESYKGKYNLLPTQEKAIPMLARASFNCMNIIALVRPVEEWRATFPDIVTDKKLVDRLEEAKSSLDFGMYTETPGIIQVVNYSDSNRRAETAEALVRVVTSTPETYTSDILPIYHAQEYEDHNRAMWEAAELMIKQAEIKD